MADVARASESVATSSREQLGLPASTQPGRAGCTKYASQGDKYASQGEWCHVCIGAAGISGASGGDKDEACVKAGIDKVADQLK